MKKWLCVASVLGLCAQWAYGQEDLERFERRMAQYQRETRIMVDHNIPLQQRAVIDFGGYFTPTYLSLDDADGKHHVLREYDLVLYGRLNIDNAQEFFVLGRGIYRDWAPGDSFDGKPDGAEGRLERAFYRFDLSKYQATKTGEVNVDFNVVGQAGRQLIYWGNGLTLTEILDGGSVTVTKGPVDLNFLAGVTPEHTVDFDSSRPNFEDQTRRGFYGGMLVTHVSGHEPYAYVLAQQDYNHDDVAQTRFNYNSEYIGLGSRGPVTDRLGYSTELVYETGSGLSTSRSLEGGTNPVPQKNEPIAAYAGDLQLDYLIPDLHKTRITGEAIIASGDPDREQTSNTIGGNRAGTEDNAFNAFGLLNTGLAFAPAVSNITVFRLGVSTFPLPSFSRTDHLQVGMDALLFLKTQRDAPIDENTDDRRYLGIEPDIFLNWQITEDLTLAVRYGVFFPGPAITSSVTSSDAPRQAFFMGITYAF